MSAPDSQSPEPTHYELLGLDRKATVEQIKEAYRDVARLYHPDSNFYAEIVSDPLSGEELDRFKRITAAYNTLVNERKRAEYDASLPPELAGWEEPAARAAARDPIRPRAGTKFGTVPEEEGEFAGRGRIKPELRSRIRPPGPEKAERYSAPRASSLGRRLSSLPPAYAIAYGAGGGGAIGMLILAYLGYL